MQQLGWRQRLGARQPGHRAPAQREQEAPLRVIHARSKGERGARGAGQASGAASQGLRGMPHLPPHIQPRLSATSCRNLFDIRGRGAVVGGDAAC